MRHAAYPAPVGLLAELTHRCPLQCPYCSNPLALEKVGGELPPKSGSMSSRRPPTSACSSCISPAASRPCGATWSRSSSRRAKVGLYTNLITAAVLAHARAPRETGEGRPRPRADFHPGHRRRERRPHRSLQERAREEARKPPAGCAISTCRSPSTPRSIARTSTACPRSSISPSALARSGSRWRTSSTTAGR